MKSIVAATLVAVLLITAVAGVILAGSRPASAAWTPPFRSVRVGVSPWTVTTFNPMKITLVDEYIVIYSVYSTLLTNDKAYNPKGDLAYDWSLAPDNVTWTFHLAQGAYFVDPTNPADTSHPVTAADVKYSYDLQIAQNASILHVYTDDIQAVNVVDDHTVQIVTKRPVSTMISTANNIPILPQYIWSAQRDPMKYSPGYPVGSGGFYYDATNSTATIAILRKSPHFYADQYYCSVIKPDEVRFISYTSASSMVLSFTSGADGLNTIIGIDPTSYKNALASWSPKFAVDQGFVGEYAINLMTDAQRAALVAGGTTQFRNGANDQVLATNWTVRRAIAMSIDKPTLISDALLGLGNLGDSLVPDTNNWHYEIPSQYLYQFNPTAARAMLNAAGWAWDSAGNAATATTVPLYQKGATNGTVYWPLKFRFYTLNTEPWWQAAAADITGWLAKSGIQTTDKLGNTVPGYGLYNINTMSGYWLSGDYDMWLWDWVFTPASNPATDILEVETTAAIGPTSDNFYSNATFDGLYNQAVTTIDPVARRAILNEMQMMIYNESSYIIPFYKDDLYAATTSPVPGGQQWLNWGNWSKYNGLTPDSDLLNLWMQIDPVDDPAPVISSFPQVQWINTTAASVGITVNDPQAATLNYTFDFGDASAPVTTTSVPVQHLFAKPGNYTIKVRVTNAEWPACGSTTATIVKGGPGSLVNLPPQVRSFGPNKTTVLVNQNVRLNLSVYDPEADNLTAVWNFGDGSATVTSYADSGTLAGVVMSQTHAYANPKTYEVTVTVTDNKTYPGLNHSPKFFTNVTVETPSSTPTGGGNAIDPLIAYGIPLLIIAVVVIAVVAVMMRRRSRTKKEEQETTQEGPKSPPTPPTPP